MAADVVTAATMTAWLTGFAQVVDQQADYLTELDAAIGDADHGSNLRRGTAAVAADFTDKPPATVEEAAKRTAMTLISKVGGASGPLYGTFFLRFATAVAGLTDVDAAGFGDALRSGVEGVTARGRADAGDKTMLDAWLPALEAYRQALPDGLAAALGAAAEAAEAGRDATRPLVARKGRASYLGERSAGHLDPGAASTAMLLRCLAEVVA